MIFVSGDHLILAWSATLHDFAALCNALRRSVALGKEIDSAWTHSDPAAAVEFERGLRLSAEVFARLLNVTKWLLGATLYNFRELSAEERQQTQRLISQGLCPLLDACNQAFSRLSVFAFAKDLGLSYQSAQGRSVRGLLNEIGIYGGDPEDVEALHHVLTRASRKGPQARWKQVLEKDGPRGLKGWLHKAVKGQGRDRARRAEGFYELPSFDEGVATGGVAELLSVHEAQSREDQIEILIANADLTERQLEILRAVEVEGARPSRVADRLGVSQSTVRNTLRTARRKCGLPTYSRSGKNPA